MIRYIIKRLLLMIPAILATSLIIFVAMNMTGGDPVDSLAPENATEEQIEEIRQQEKAKAEQKYCGQIAAERQRAEAAEQKLRQQPVRSEAVYTAEEADDARERFVGALWSGFEQFTALLSRTEGKLALSALNEAAEEIDEIRQEIRLMSNLLISQQEIDLPPYL